MVKIDDIWQDLERKAEEKNETGVIRRLFSADIALYINLGIYAESMNHFLSFEIKDELLSNYKALPSIKGIKIQKTSFGDERCGSVSLALAVTSKIYNDSFDLFSSDLIDYIKDYPENELIAKLADRLGLWKKFFSETPREILTEEKQIGLAGELNLINTLLERDVSATKTIHSWKGFDNSSKDFVFNNGVCIEVKASKSPKTVKISSEDQLDETGLNECYLNFCHFAFSKDAEFSLNILVDSIREKLSNNANICMHFDAGLLQYGYCDIHRDYYNRLFTFKKEVSLLIESDFPRIRKSDIREGVNSVWYTIDLSNTDQYERPFSDMVRVIKSEEDDG